MKITVDPSTGVPVELWRQGQLFHATRAEAPTLPQICLGVDLFEVIAELAGLDLERPAEAEEAARLAHEVQQRLGGAACAEETRSVERQQRRERAN